MIERRVSNVLSNDLLLQLLDHHVENAKILGEIHAKVDALAGPMGRITKLEHAANTNFWVSYIATPLTIGLHITARALGVKI